LTLLTLIQDATNLIGLDTPNVVISSTDKNIKTLLAMANVEGKSLKNRGQWALLSEEHTFDTVSGTASYALPDNYDSVMNGTGWNRGTNFPLRASITPRDWQASKSGLIQSTIYNSGYRIKGSSAEQFFVDPTPDSVQTMVYEYQSNEWCRSSGGTGQTDWAADDDEAILDEELMLLGVEWRFRRAKGLSYLAMQREYDELVDKRLASEAGAPVIQTSDTDTTASPPGNIPETGFGT
jgi:hypothetical protein